MLSDWVLYRLTGRFVTDPSSGSSSDLFDLRDADLVDRRSLELVGLDPAIVPEVLEPGTVVGPLTGRGGRRDGPRGRARRSSSAAPTRSSGWSGSASSRPDRLTLVGGSFWQLTVGDRRAAHRPAGPGPDALPRGARASG